MLVIRNILLAILVDAYAEVKETIDNQHTTTLPQDLLDMVTDATNLPSDRRLGRPGDKHLREMVQAVFFNKAVDAEEKKPVKQ